MSTRSDGDPVVDEITNNIHDEYQACLANRRRISRMVTKYTDVKRHLHSECVNKPGVPMLIDLYGIAAARHNQCMLELAVCENSILTLENLIHSLAHNLEILNNLGKPELERFLSYGDWLDLTKVQEYIDIRLKQGGHEVIETP